MFCFINDFFAAIQDFLGNAFGSDSLPFSIVRDFRCGILVPWLGCAECI